MMVTIKYTITTQIDNWPEQIPKYEVATEAYTETANNKRKRRLEEVVRSNPELVAILSESTQQTDNKRSKY